MLRTPTRRPTRPRRGAILLVVITLLALFAVIGLSFALYADAEATAARMHREAQSGGRDGEDIEAVLNPDQAFNEGLGQLLFGTRDDGGTNPRALQSGFRGYEFARLMYGQPRTPGTLNPMPLLTPYTGTGLFTAADQGPALPFFPPGRAQVINYAWLPGSGYIVDPEYTEYRTDPTQLNGPSGPQTYKNVAAPYTYPDLKDLFLAVIDPTTGRVLQPSFFRDYAFNAAQTDPRLRLAPPPSVNPTPGQNNGLTPVQDEWLTPAGRLRIIRPRPIDHMYDPDNLGPAQPNTEFPYPPPNADGSYTGDVTNFPGLNGSQRHDSVWVYPGGAIKTFRGKRYTALIAPLVIDLGGRVNLGVAGNRKDTLNNHASSQGWGPWEINPQWVFDPTAATRPAPSAPSGDALRQLLGGNDFQTTNGTYAVSGRYGVPVGTQLPPADKFTGLNQVQFNGGRIPPHYAGPDVDGVGAGLADRAVPSGSGTSPSPVFPASRYVDATSQATELGNHPGQYNAENYSRLIPAAQGGGFGPFLHIDERVMGTKYAGPPEPYSRTDVGRLAPRQLISGNLNPATAFDPYSTPANPQSTTTDPANLTRMLVTTFSTSLNRTDVVVAAVGGQSARLGPIDMNRSPVDYRDLTLPANQPTPKMLGPDNMGNWANAQIARQRMARDVFVRLVAVYSDWLVSQGQPALIDGTNIAYVNDPAQADYGYLRFAASVAQLPILRQYAQIAVNMVDYIDPDDIATTFTFNPTKTSPGDALVAASGLPNMTVVPPNEFGNHVVYGTEAPRLVLNEAYATVTNDRRDYDPPAVPGPNPGPGATHNLEKRFWVELFNPMRPGDPALSERGLARLHYPANTFGTHPPFSPYQIVITQGATPPTDPANVTRTPRHPSIATPNVKLVVDRWADYDTTATTPIEPTLDAKIAAYPDTDTATGTVPATNVERCVVHPHDPAANTQASRLNRNGFAVIGPATEYPGQTGGATPPPDFIGATLRIQGQDPNNPNPPQLALNGTDLSGMSYDAGTKDPGAPDPHTVYLRRAANPYILPNDPFEPNFNSAAPVNPYITVDAVGNLVPTNLAYFNGTGPAPTPPTPNATHSQGRQHPFAAATAIDQNPAAPLAASPQSTLFQPNEPRDPSFRWLVHLDRQLTNPLELAHVSAYQPGRLTEFFAHTPTGTPPLFYHQHSIESYLLAGVAGGTQQYPVGNNPPSVLPPANVGFARKALDLLVANGLQSGVPVGGRVQGKININTVWHPSVLRALFDRNDANFFRDRDVAETNPNPLTPETDDRSAWNRMTKANNGSTIVKSQHRSPAWPNVTQNDTPFKGMGDLILRGYTAGGTAYPPATRPLFHNQNPADDTTNFPTDPASGRLPEQVLATQDHTALIAEPLKKMWNNATTTSDGFLVIMTIGFFEVRNDPANTPGGRVYLGKELYENVPGDRRFRFFSIVDRTQLALDPTPSAGPPPQQLQAPSTPWQTALLDDVVPGATTIRVAADPTGRVYVDGNPVDLTQVGQNLRLGFGDGTINGGDGEAVTVTAAAVGPPNSGSVTLTVSAVQRYHAAGSPVGNYLLGNPGPQPSFDPNSPRYKSVVPYFARVAASQ